MFSLRSAGLLILLLVLLSSISMGYCYKVVDVACGEYHSLLLMKNGSLWSCGDNTNLTLGTDDVAGYSVSPMRVKGENGIDYLTEVVSFDAGWYHSLACDELGRMWAWGTDNAGQLGNGTAGNSVFPQRVKSPDGLGYLADIVYVSAGRSGTHSLAVTGDGFVYGWGNNTSGQCGTGSPGGNLQLPVQVRKTGGAFLNGIKEVCAGISHSLALDNNGDVWEFGINKGSLATLVSGLPEIVQLATCGHSLALDVNGNVWYWTSGTPIKVTDGEMNTASGYLENIKEISAGSSYGVAVDNNGHVWKWSIGSLPVHITDGQMNTASGYLENITAIDGGYYDFQLVVDNNGVAWGWGTTNNYGELGVGDALIHSEPTQLACAEGYLDLSFEQVAENSCCSPADEVTVTVCAVNDTGAAFEDVNIVLYLDEGFTYPDGMWSVDENMEPYQPDPRYDADTHSIIFTPNTDGTVEPGLSECEVFTLLVNENAEPGMPQVNIAKLFVGEVSDQNIIVARTRHTEICCWTTIDTIFVDQYATGSDSGMSWADAYNGTDGLSKALNQAKNSTCGGPFTIYIASGNYFPGTQEDDSFVLPEGTEIYGGFPTGGCNFTARNPKVYEALLSGRISDEVLAETVVTMGHNSLLDGVAVEFADTYNVFGNTADFSLKNCSVRDSRYYGIYSLNGNVSIERCKIQENFADGIYHSGAGFILNVMNSWVMRSGRYGIYTIDSTLIVKNSNVSESDMKEQGSEGIRMLYPTDSPQIYNCTISKNKGAGLMFVDIGTMEDPNDYPDIQNCIVYFNNAQYGIYGAQLSGVDADVHAAYSCIQNCTEVNNNFNANPSFAYSVNTAGEPDPNNFHIGFDSVCVDRGNSAIESLVGNSDYDNESRIAGLSLDVGADEVHFCSGEETKADISNDLDMNKDGIVNMLEYQYIAKAWLGHDPNDPLWLEDPNMLNMEYTHPVLGPACYALAWNPDCNYDNTGDSQYNIDIADLIVFLQDGWLWQACWYEPYNSSSATMMATMAMLPEPEIETLSLSRSSSDNITTLARTTSKLLFVEEPELEDVSPYAYMSNSELAEFVRDIKDLKEMVQLQADSDGEDSEDVAEILLFFDDILLEVKDYLTGQEE